MNKETIIKFFKPSYHRTLLTIFSLLIYNNTYSNTSVHILSGGIIAPLLFPSFYLLELSTSFVFFTCKSLMIHGVIGHIKLVKKELRLLPQEQLYMTGMV